MVALHGWMLARMSPCDLDAFLEGATATVGTCNRLTGSMLLHLWAMAFLKWPKCVTQWASVVSDAAGRPGVSAGSLDVQAEFFASKSVELACHCDMDDMPWMHEQISVGLQNVLFGPVVWLAKLGMQQANDSKRRKKYKTSEQFELHCVSVSLGKKHTSYHIVPKTAVWKELLVHASAFDEKFSHGLGLPQSHAELQAFIEAVDLFLQGFPTAFGYAEKAMETKKATKSRDAEENTYYCRKFILRKILLWVHSKTDAGIWEQVRVADLRRVCADKKCVLHQLEDSMTWTQATHRFTVNPLMISCWACLFGQVVKPAHQKVFDHPDTHLWQIVLQLTRRHAGVQPNLRSVALQAVECYKNRG